MTTSPESSRMRGHSSTPDLNGVPKWRSPSITTKRESFLTRSWYELLSPASMLRTSISPGPIACSSDQNRPKLIELMASSQPPSRSMQKDTGGGHRHFLRRARSTVLVDAETFFVSITNLRMMSLLERSRHAPARLRRDTSPERSNPQSPAASGCAGDLPANHTEMAPARPTQRRSNAARNRQDTRTCGPPRAGHQTAEIHQCPSCSANRASTDGRVVMTPAVGPEPDARGGRWYHPDASPQAHTLTAGLKWRHYRSLKGIFLMKDLDRRGRVAYT